MSSHIFLRLKSQLLIGVYATMTSFFSPMLIFVSYISDGDRDPQLSCSLFQSVVTVVVIPLSTYFYLMRAWWLLFRNEITLDITGRQQNTSSFISVDQTINKGPPRPTETKQASSNNYMMIEVGNANTSVATNLPHQTSKPQPLSWYTLHYRYVSFRYILAFASPLIVFGSAIVIIIGVARPPGPCDQQADIWANLQIGYAFIAELYLCISILNISRKLAQFDRDILGVKKELIASAVLTFGFGIVGVPVAIAIGGASALLGDTWAIVMVSLSLLLWCWVSL
jgi:hypothetical protein